MQVAELSTVKHLLKLAAPLPFNVRDADKTLLLARGHRIETAAQLEALCRRGALVDIAELATLPGPRPDPKAVPRRALPGLWSRCLQDLSQTLQQASDTAFRTALDDAAAPVLALVERDPELAIFQVLRAGGNADVAYGVRRSVQCAITGHLIAQRLAWEPDTALRLFKVALTMNLSMLELQGQLARQTTPPTAAQRSDLQTHPMRSVRMLEQAGVTDAAWLRAVLQHHEEDGGHGYPAGHGEAGELASLARRADVYTSKLAARSTRDALSADQAGRQMFMQDPGHPMTAALVKEFGIYPPGCFVRLASGEMGVVAARGPTITAPVVLCLTSARGAPIAAPVRRETHDKAHAVVGVVGEAAMPAKPSLDKLAALILE